MNLHDYLRTTYFSFREFLNPLQFSRNSVLTLFLLYILVGKNACVKAESFLQMFDEWQFKTVGFKQSWIQLRCVKNGNCKQINKNQACFLLFRGRESRILRLTAQKFYLEYGIIGTKSSKLTGWNIFKKLETKHWLVIFINNTA